MDFNVAISAIKGFPGHKDYVATPSVPDLGFVTKWGGACMQDYSSGMGGWCLFENNDTPFWDCHHVSNTYAAPGYNGNVNTKLRICGGAGTCTGSQDVVQADAHCASVGSPNCVYEENRGGPVNIFWNRQLTSSMSTSGSKGTAVYKKDSNRAMMFLRLAKADFTTLADAWKNTALMCDKTDGSYTGELNLMDGRSYFLSVRTKVVDQGSKIVYFDYPKCTLDAPNSNYACSMFLPARASQTAGYARFDQPGVIKGFYVTPYIPGVELIALSTATELNSASGAMSLVTGAVVTGILATMF